MTDEAAPFDVEDLEALAPPPRKSIGVIDVRATRIAAFVIISLGVIGCAVVCVLSVWQILEPDYAWRSIVTLAIVAAATGIFVTLNEGFGPAMRKVGT